MSFWKSLRQIRKGLQNLETVSWQRKFCEKYFTTHLILYLTWLLCLAGDPTICAVVKKSENFSSYGEQETTKKHRQNNVCFNHAPEEFVEHPENCRLFYLCREDGEAVVASCPPTMLFNPDSKLCDNASNVRCRTSSNATDTAQPLSSSSSSSSTIIDSTTTTTTTATPSISNPNEIADVMQYCASLTPPSEQQDVNHLTFIGSSSSCQRYYICYYGQALLQECSANLHWNANIGKCDLPLRANCRLQQPQQQQQQNNNSNNNNNNGIGNGNGSGTSNNGNNIASNGGSGSGSGTNGNSDQFINCPNYGQHIFPHLGRCDFFIYCVKGHATLQQCPFYYHFDIVAKTCKWRTTAICVRDLNIDFQKTANRKHL